MNKNIKTISNFFHLINLKSKRCYELKLTTNFPSDDSENTCKQVCSRADTSPEGSRKKRRFRKRRGEKGKGAMAVDEITECSFGFTM